MASTELHLPNLGFLECRKPVQYLGLCAKNTGPTNNQGGLKSERKAMRAIRKAQKPNGLEPQQAREHAGMQIFWRGLNNQEDRRGFTQAEGPSRQCVTSRSKGSAVCQSATLGRGCPAWQRGNATGTHLKKLS